MNLLDERTGTARWRIALPGFNGAWHSMAAILDVIVDIRPDALVTGKKDGILQGKVPLAGCLL